MLFEDFNELTVTESYLKNIGFDTLSMTNEIGLATKVLSFNPDVVLVSGEKRVSPISVGAKLKEDRNFHGKALYILPEGYKLKASDVLSMKTDGIINAPVSPDKLIHFVCKAKNLSGEVYVEKLLKLKLSPELTLLLKKSLEQSAAAAAESKFVDLNRRAKYAKLSREAPPIDTKETTISRAGIKEKWDKVAEGFDKNEELIEEKRNFVKALFKGR